MKQKIKIGDCKDFDFLKKSLVLLKGENITDRSVSIYDEENKELTIISNSVIPAFKVSGNRIWVYNPPNGTIEYSAENNFSGAKLPGVCKYRYEEVNILVSEVINNDKRNLVAFDFDTKIEKWKLDFSSTLILFDETIFVIQFSENLSKKIFLSINLFNGDYKWIYNIDAKVIWNREYEDSTRPEFERIAGSLNGIVWLSLTSGRLIALSNSTGELLYNITEPNIKPDNLFFTDDYYWIGRYHQLDKNQGKLFGLRGNFYWEIDLANPTETYEVFDISESCKKNGIRADMPTYEWPVQGNEILFGEIFESPKNEKLNNVGLFNRDTKQIIWTDRIGEEGEFLPVIQKLEMQDDRLFILDGKNTLFIYERTQ
jgi:outer membrane protein assembly factor BamB